MAENQNRPQTPDTDEVDVALLTADDPGGSHAKGYTAEPGPLPDLPAQGPLPLAPASDEPAVIHVPERDNHVQPTGRHERSPHLPSDRLIGADR